MSNPITKSEAFELLLQLLPDAREAWNKHVREWEGEHESVPYIGMAVFARCVVKLFGAGKTESFPGFFQAVERLIVEGDEEVRGLAIVGLLESLQNNASWEDFGHEVFVEWQQPESRAAWYEIERIWAGKHSLADVIRAERELK